MHRGGETVRITAIVSHVRVLLVGGRSRASFDLHCNVECEDGRGAGGSTVTLKFVGRPLKEVRLAKSLSRLRLSQFLFAVAAGVCGNPMNLVNC